MVRTYQKAKLIRTTLKVSLHWYLFRYLLVLLQSYYSLLLYLICISVLDLISW